MTEKTLPTPEELRKRLRYDPETGKLYWLRGVCEIVEAFTARDNGRYLNGRINQKTFRAHRVIWALVYGEWPKGEIDHINGQRDDNRLVNLRCVTRAENGKNRARRFDNTSGRTGVRLQKKTGRWEARIKVDGRCIHLGTFQRIEDAVRAREKAEIRHGFHPNHDRLW
jgi:hypothetical protein